MKGTYAVILTLSLAALGLLIWVALQPTVGNLATAPAFMLAEGILPSEFWTWIALLLATATATLSALMLATRRVRQ